MQRTFLLAISPGAMADMPPLSICAIRAPNILAATRRVLEGVAEDQIEQHFTTAPGKNMTHFAQTTEVATCILDLVTTGVDDGQETPERKQQLMEVSKNLVNLVYPRKEAVAILYQVDTIEVFDADDIIV
jgi:hypothetical protein